MIQAETEHLIDLRPIPPRDRHSLIFESWEKLLPGGSLLLVNDHDPVPLYYQFAAEHRGGFHWEYLDQGPEVFRVRIAKGHFCDPGFVPVSRAKPSSVPPQEIPGRMVEPLVLDTRPIFDRGETPCDAIDAAVETLLPGQMLVLLVPFNPVPLYLKLGKQGFTYEAQPQNDGSWRVEFRRK